MDESAHILIVDDNDYNLKVVGSFLKEKDYKIAFANDGESALNLLSQNKFDLILLDIMMPGMDGFEVCRIIKERPETKNIPVIFLTARIETESIVKGFQVGGVDYLTKPFNKEELYARVNNHLLLKKAREEALRREAEAVKSRDQYMRTLYGLSKILSGNK